MNFKLIATTLAFVLAVGTITACGQAETPTVEPVAAASTAEQPAVVSAEAFVVPLKDTDLAFEIGGRVASVEVKEGDEVKKGVVLAKLDDLTQQASLGEAEAGVAQAKANLTTDQARLSEAEASLESVKSLVAEAEAKLAQAQALLATDEARLEAAIKAKSEAEASLAQAQAALDEIVAGPTKEDIAQAQAQVASAQAGLNKVLAKARDEDVQAASAQMLQAEAEVRLAQADYDKFVYGDPKVAEPYGVALQKATLNYQAAQATYNKLVNGATAEDIAVARASVAEAQAGLQKVLAGATPEQIAQTQAGVAIAEAGLDQAQANIDIAQAQVEASRDVVGQAEAGLATSKLNVAQAQAGVDTAKAQIEATQGMVGEAEARKKSAQVQLDKTNLLAPFAGTVGELNLDEGEIVQAGSVALSLGDSSKWQIETDDLTEIDVVNVREGANVTISVDALPGEEFSGKVVRITPKSITKAGDVTYTVLIDITSGDVSRLRWGMTTFVDIEVGPEL